MIYEWFMSLFYKKIEIMNMGYVWYPKKDASKFEKVLFGLLTTAKLTGKTIYCRSILNQYRIKIDGCNWRLYDFLSGRYRSDLDIHIVHSKRLKIFKRITVSNTLSYVIEYKSTEEVIKILGKLMVKL
ncbi:hypothetical protein D3C71_1443420 [compost metagenome]